MKTALITGITGQDGSYLAELLLNKGYKVHGLVRRCSTPNDWRIKHLEGKIILHEGDITDYSSVSKIVKALQPDEIYNLAAMSFVGASFKQPFYTFQCNALGPLNLLEAIRNESSHSKYYQASTSEQFGSNYNTNDCGVKYQDENTEFAPRSPYAVSKIAAHHLVENYRESYGLFAVSSILFNHESPRRGPEFVTRKITKWIGEYLQWRVGTDINKLLYNGTNIVCSDHMLYGPCYFPKLSLGNINAYRDWGHAKDYVNAIHMIMQQSKPDDFVISTGETHSVRDFLEVAFNYVNLGNYERYITIDKDLFRPAEVDYLCGDSSKARKTLYWEPTYTFEQLVIEMLEADIEKAKAVCSSVKTK